uniref:GAF domain-containing protein n=1 Tax=Streptomyces corallincola TaxID=2851888 RepID=UPI0027E2CFF0|nr:GAF domain-containing protein [Streptomyces corallincola]
MVNAPVDVARLTAVDTARAARVLTEVREATLAGRRAPLPPRPVIEQSWGRVLRGGVDPDRGLSPEPLSAHDLGNRREASPLRPVLEELRRGLLTVADGAQHIMLVAEADGRVLWREGAAPVLRRADALGLETGADWSEGTVGTNGVGTPAVVGRPVQVFASEHFVRTHASWTCAGAPVTDPRNGRPIGVVDVSGPLETMHPATLAWVESVARLAEARLREMHLTELDRLRTVGVPVLTRLSGQALVVDRDGWSAAVTGMPYIRRVALPKSAAPGRRWLPGLGVCLLEPLAGGWLLRVAEQPGRTVVTRVLLDLSRPGRTTLTVVSETGTWTRELSPRHAELLYLLAEHRDGRGAAGLADDLFGDASRTVTVRAELSRIRRYLGGVLQHRPYRFSDGAEVEVVLPANPVDLLPRSLAPGVAVRRAMLAGGVRRADA